MQPIIPLSDLTRIGIRIEWQENSCRMYKPGGDLLPTHLECGCPVIGMREGLRLMRDVEAHHREKIGVRKVFKEFCAQAGRGLCDDEMAKRALELRRLFPHAPEHIAERVLGIGEPDTDESPIEQETPTKD